MSGTLAVFYARLRNISPIAVIFVLTLPIHAAAQTVNEIFQDTTDVIEVQVPVNVVGKGGEPVRGLTVEDFKIFDGNQRQEITGFRVIDLELVEPGTTQTEIDRAVPAAARRHFLLLFDLTFSTPVSVLKAREAARKFVLESLHPTDLAAVATHDAEWGPKLIVTFTPDRVQLARAIDGLGAARFNMAAGGRSDPLRFMVPELSQTSPGISDPLTAQPSGDLGPVEGALLNHLTVVAKQQDRMEKSYSRGRIFSWAGSMAELARLLDSVKGRKHVVYFTEGFDGSLLLGRTPDPDDPETIQNRLNIEQGNLWMVDSDDLYGSVPLQNQLAATLEEFRRADAVIQAVDI
ncbi:MAG: VWA domain-containing protein, partial [Thermoanaerobaculia bacterium]